MKIATDGKVSEVVVTNDKNETVAGAVSDDGVWKPNNQLAYGTKYSVAATATNKDGAPTKATSAFTTMSAPGKTNGVDFYVENGAKVGVGLPIVFKFTYSVPTASRTAVQKAMSIRTSQPDRRRVALGRLRRAALSAAGILAGRHQDRGEVRDRWRGHGQRSVREPGTARCR